MLRGARGGRQRRFLNQSLGAFVIGSCCGIDNADSKKKVWALIVGIIALYGKRQYPRARKIISWQGNIFKEFCLTDLFCR